MYYSFTRGWKNYSNIPVSLPNMRFTWLPHLEHIQHKHMWLFCEVARSLSGFEHTGKKKAHYVKRRNKESQDTKMWLVQRCLIEALKDEWNWKLGRKQKLQRLDWCQTCNNVGRWALCQTVTCMQYPLRSWDGLVAIVVTYVTKLQERISSKPV